MNSRNYSAKWADISFCTMVMMKIVTEVKSTDDQISEQQIYILCNDCNFLIFKLHEVLQ